MAVHRGAHDERRLRSRTPRDTIPAHSTRARMADRKSTRLNSSHANISYAVFCLKKKNNGLAFAASLLPLPPLLALVAGPLRDVAGHLQPLVCLLVHHFSTPLYATHALRSYLFRY